LTRSDQEIVLTELLLQSAIHSIAENRIVNLSSNNQFILNRQLKLLKSIKERMEQSIRSQNQHDNDYIFEKNTQHEQTSFLFDEANNNNLLNTKRV
jgi:hypothetical protein